MRVRWIALCSDLSPVGDPAALWDSLERLYASPPRAYHNLRHIRACLDLFDQWKGRANDPRAVEFAIWLHDCIYEPGAEHNEARSAGVALEFVSALGLMAPFGRSVERLILATRHGRAIAQGDEALLADIDMAILAAAPAEYDAYAAAVRSEYAFATDEQWRRGRGAFLRGQLDAPAVYLSPAGAAFEAAARANMQRELSALRGGVSPAG